MKKSDNRYPIVSFIGWVEDGKTSLIKALWKRRKNEITVSETIPGRGEMNFIVRELPSIIISLSDKWFSDSENIRKISETDTIVYMLPSQTFGYDEELCVLNEIRKINPLVHIIIACSKIDLLFTQQTNKKHFTENILQLERTIIETYQHTVGEISLSDVVLVSGKSKWNIEQLRERIWNNVIEKNNDDIFDYNIPTLVISGKRGCGKSSTLNKLFDLNLPVNMSTACTKYPRVMRIDFEYNTIPMAFNLVDLPGIAESINADMAYSQFYRKYIEKADVLLCLTQADTRAYLQDQNFYTQLIKNKLLKKHTNVILGINQIDLLFKTFENPDGIDLNTIDECNELLTDKVNDFYSIYKNIFRNFPNISVENIVVFSASLEWNTNKLKEIIFNRLKNN